MSTLVETIPAAEPVGLDELVEVANLQTRRDRKYILREEDVWGLFDDIAPRVLEIDGRRSFRYESVYFDTAHRDSFLGAAHRRPRRFKVRTRTYLDSGECLLEVKVRDHRGNTVKHRQPHELGSRWHLSTAAVAYISRIGAAAPFANDLRPALEVCYLRSTLLLASAGRVTVDRAVTWTGIDKAPAIVGGIAIVETKSAGPPTEVDRKLWLTGHRPSSISKYCTGLAAIEPGLPSNQWHRVLQRRILPNLRVGGLAALPDADLPRHTHGRFTADSQLQQTNSPHAKQTADRR